MKKTFILIITMAMVLVFSMQAQAALQTIGTATYNTLDYNLIYDDDLNITWLDYTATGDTWANQNNWASGLNTGGVLTYNFNAGVSMNWSYDWRLPTTTQPDSNCASQLGNPKQGYGWNCTGSEMGHLYYTELGNVSGIPLIISGDFQHLQSNNTYWSGTEFTLVANNAWKFNFNGFQLYDDKSDQYSAIAVRSGQLAVVPEPISSTLFIIGGATLGFRRLRKKFKK